MGIHSVPIAWLYYTHMTESSDSHPPEKLLRTDLTCWDWILGFVLSFFISTPQVIVLAAQCRVRRLSNERARIRFPSPSREPQTVANPTVSLQPEDERNTPHNNMFACPMISKFQRSRLLKVILMIYHLPTQWRFSSAHQNIPKFKVRLI